VTTLATTATQSQFAGLLGCNKSHITRLKQAGRLVLDGQGLVLVEASKLRIAETEGGRDDVAARHAAEKGQQARKPDESRVSAQTRKEMAQADVAEMDRDLMRGKLIEREQVEMALADLVAFARQGVENLPHRVAAQLVGKDFDQIMATLKQEVVAIMGDMHKEAGKRLVELTKVDA
jgi:phage terminase Nu1 subunit (DNA packaging protein)